MQTNDADAQAALLFSEMTCVEQEVLRQPYPEIKYPQIVPVDTSAPEGIESIAFKALDFSGRPQRLGAQGGDVPLVEVASSKGSVTVETFAQGYNYRLMEVMKAKELANQSRSAAINYLAEKANGARQVTEQFLDELFFIGDTQADGLELDTGLFNDPDVPVYATGAFIPDGTDRTISTILGQPAPDKVANDLLYLFMNAREEVRVTQTNTTFRPTHIGLPPTQYGKMEAYRIPNTADTLISYLERVVGVEFFEHLHLQGRGESGGDRMMVYTRDEKYVKGHMPMPFQIQAPATEDNVNFKSAGLVRVAGTELRIPKMHAYVDGV